MSNCIEKFVEPPETKPTYLTVHKEKFLHYVSQVKVELDMGTHGHDARAQLIPQSEQPNAKPPESPQPFETGDFDPGDDKKHIPPSCTFEEVPYRDGQVPAGVTVFKLVVWYQCDGTNWEVDDIDITDSN